MIEKLAMDIVEATPVSCALSNDFLNSSNENERLYSSKFSDLKFNLVFSFCF